jgi:hypothetical protein
VTTPPFTGTIRRAQRTLVFALVTGAFAACREATTPSVPTSIVASHDSVRVDVMGSLQLSAVVMDNAGRPMTGRTITWTAMSVGFVTVSSTGLVTWNGPGRTLVIAKDGALADTVKVVTGGDVAVAAVQLTQGVQDAAATVPLIAQGQAAAAVVMLTSAATATSSSMIVLRLYDISGAAVYADTEIVSGIIGATPLLDAPNATFLIPAAQLQFGRSWRVFRDPAGETADDSAANDVFPRDGPAPLTVTNVAPLNVRFVPITLSSNGGTTPSIVASDLPGYMRTALASLPLGPVTTTIGDAFATSANFGTPPSGAAPTFWLQVLQELDAARVASTDQASHWYGVISPPPGFNNVQNGGYAYVPSNGTASDARTRTALGIRTGWFFNQTQARDLVAHELSHNFGRRHTPCGGPSNIDASYPRTDGRIGDIMHDVHGWATGLSTSLAVVGALTGDIMGYCFPGWASVYTYKGVLAFRGPPILASVLPPEREPLVVVQGSVGANGVVLEDPIALTGTRTPETQGLYRLEGLDAAGGVVFDRAFETKEVDHADVRHFTVAIPHAVASRARTLRVDGPAGAASLDVAAAETMPDVRAVGGNAIAIGCGSTSARVAVQDPSSGELLGIARGELRLAGARGRRLAVSCASGSMPRQLSITAP